MDPSQGFTTPIKSSMPAFGTGTPYRTPKSTKQRIDGAALTKIESTLAAFKQAPPSDEQLSWLAHCVRPEAAVIAQNKESLHRVTAALLQADFGGPKVARVALGGPSCRASGLKDYQEAEMVVFFDGLQSYCPPRGLLERLAQVLEPLCSGRYGGSSFGADTPGVPATSAEVRRSRVRAKIDGIDVSIHAAANLVPAGSTEADLVACQRAAALALPPPRSSSRTERDAFRASLQETVAEFLESRPPGAHEMMRLALLWRAVNLLPRRVKAPAYLFELLGLMAYGLAARRAAKGEAPGLYKCYLEFLTMLNASSTLEVRWGAYYDASSVAQDVILQRPLVLDPACPYNNVASLLNEDGWKMVKRLARASESALEMARKSGAGGLMDAIRAQDFFC